MPIYGYIGSNDLRLSAEALVVDTLNAQFAQDTAPVTVQVLGDRNGDIVPLLTTTVSRQQWRDNPRIEAWTQYYEAYALFRRHDGVSAIAAVPSASGRSNRADTPPDLLRQIEASYDAGVLSGRQAQDYLSDLD